MSRFARTNYANVHYSFLALLRLERRQACLRRASNQRDARDQPSRNLPGSIDPRFLRRGQNCLCREIKAALCFVLEDRSPAQTAPVRINCERINAPFGNDDSLSARAFAFTRTLQAPASSSRGRDCGRNQLAGNAGLFQFTHFIRYDCTIIQNLFRREENAAAVQLSNSKL